jgi:hypothetical protein
MFSFGWYWSPSINGRPRCLATSLPIVVLPQPVTPITTTIIPKYKKIVAAKNDCCYLGFYFVDKAGIDLPGGAVSIRGKSFVL